MKITGRSILIVVALVVFVGWFAFQHFFARQFAEKVIEKTLKTATGRTNVDIDYSSDGTGFSYEMDGLKLNAGKDAKLPIDFPTDIPLYPDAQLASTMINTETTLNNPLRFTLSFTTQDSMQKIKSFYETNMIANGWTDISNSKMGAGIVVAMQKEQRQVFISSVDNAFTLTLVEIVENPNNF